MLRILISACVAVALVAATSSFVQAQGFGRSTTSAFGSGSSGFGGSGFGGSGFSGSGMGGSGFGGSGMGGSGMGGGGMGSSGFGGGGFGGSGFGGGGMGGSGFGGSGMGGGGFGGGQGMGGGNYGGGGGGQNFVGRDSSDMAATWSQMGQAGAQFFNQMNSGMGRNNRRDRESETTKNAPLPMRVNIQVAFNAPRPTPDQLTTNIRTRLGRVLAEQGMALPQVTMEGDIAVLGGIAATESQRLVMERLIMLEPGVRAVRNEMTVAAPTASEASAPAGN